MLQMAVFRDSTYLAVFLVCSFVCINGLEIRNSGETAGCKSHEFTCSDGSCVSDRETCAQMDQNQYHGMTGEGCPNSRPVKCHGESQCIALHEQCDHYCDCTNCSDEDPQRCQNIDIHHHGDIHQGQLFPTGTLFLVAMVFVMWSVYVYFKRKIRDARMQHAAVLNHMQTDEPAGMLVPRVIPGDLSSGPVITADNSIPIPTSRGFIQPSRIINININPDRPEDPTSGHNDAPPAYTEAITDPQYTMQSSLLQPEGSIPPPPAYEAVSSNTQRT